VILADTSVWIAHFRVDNPHLTSLGEKQQILRHDFIIGELACGNLPARQNFLTELWEYPPVTQASNQQAFEFLETHKLWGLGLGWIDLHLLTSAVISHAQLWTLDRRLVDIAARFAISYSGFR
jgi:predicted nucleic acid-binding protein